VPVNLVLGNHDLEGFDDFQTDAENLEGWKQRFGEHYWVREIGKHILSAWNARFCRQCLVSAVSGVTMNGWRQGLASEIGGHQNTTFLIDPLFGCKHGFASAVLDRL
jgi:hypothetical protein